MAVRTAAEGVRERALGRETERPVFVDESGRRARRVRWVIRTVAALMPAWLAAVVVGALTPVGLPALPVEVAASRGPAPVSAAPASPVSAAGPVTRTVAFAGLTYRFGSGHRGRPPKPEERTVTRRA
ncbi:MAG TPA: hypothetical protein VGY97_03080 [Solirubrobacteraceae bacterium]|nr:hypothetical protein [Solirubrobacteraceae bacterium]